METTFVLLVLWSYRAALASFILDKSAVCEDEKIHFSIAFGRPFNGVIYSDGHYGDPHCTYVNETSATRYDFAIPINDCNSGKAIYNSSVQHQLIVQRDAKVLSGQDQLLYIICLSAVSAQLHSSSLPPSMINFDGVKVALKLDSQAAVRVNMARNINYTAEIRTAPDRPEQNGAVGRLVQGDLNVGQPLSYVVRVRGEGPLYVRMGRCWANDDYSNITLCDDSGCPSPALKNIWSDFQTIQLADGEVLLYNRMKAWAFPTSNRLNIMCNLHFCSSPCTSKCS